MKIFLACALTLSTILVFPNEDLIDDFVRGIIEFDFALSERSAAILDEGSEIPHFFYISQFIYNAGQYPEKDKARIEYVDKYSPTSLYDSALLYLANSVYYLHNEPASSKSFEYLTLAIDLAKTQKDIQLLKLTNLLMLELYERELVQSNEDYAQYLSDFENLAKTESEMARFLLYKTSYITKSISDDNAEESFKNTYNELQSHFTDNKLTFGLECAFLFNKAIFQKFQMQLDDAEIAFKEVIMIAGDLPYLKYLKFSSFLHLSQISSINSDYSLAEGYLTKARSNWNKSDSLRSQFIQDRLSAIYYYSNIDLYDSAYALLLSSIRIGGLLDYRKNALQVSELNVKLRTAEKENEILIQKNQLDTQQKWLLTVTLFSIVLALLSIALVLTFKKIKAKNRKIETLMRELHHRVKNNLQVISSLLGLQSMKLKDPTARKAVTEGKDRLRAMSLIHQKLYQNEDAISLNIKEYISNLVMELAQSYGFQSRTKFSIDIPSIDMDPDNSLPLGLIVNELVSNSFKYAYTNVEEPVLELKLLQESTKEFSFLIRDNGPGLPDGFVVEEANSFGMKLVSILVKQLNGNMSISSENGFCFQFDFRIK